MSSAQGRRSCDVRTAARVLRWYVAEFGSAPAILNLVEGTPPLRIELVRKFLATRSDLRAWWLPRWLLRLLNGPAILAQRLLGAEKPVNLYAAFAGACYRTDLAATVIERARG